MLVIYITTVGTILDSVCGIFTLFIALPYTITAEAAWRRRITYADFAAGAADAAGIVIGSSSRFMVLFQVDVAEKFRVANAVALLGVRESSCCRTRIVRRNYRFAGRAITLILRFVLDNIITAEVFCSVFDSADICSQEFRKAACCLIIIRMSCNTGIVIRDSAVDLAA